MSYKICCSRMVAPWHISCPKCHADIAEARIWKAKEPAIVCLVCRVEITWREWWLLPKCGDGTTDPELLEPGEEPETRHCRCGSTITVDLARISHRQ